MSQPAGPNRNIQRYVRGKGEGTLVAVSATGGFHTWGIVV